MCNARIVLHEILALCLLGTAMGVWARGDELHVGATSVSITPDEPVALLGQMHPRITKAVESPVTAASLALETRRGPQSVEQAVFVACDLGVLRGPKRDDRGALIAEVRRRVKARLSDLDVRKIILSATHTHSAPTMVEGFYDLPTEGVMQPAAYFEFLVARLCDAIVTAWQSRRPGSVGWGLGQAVVAENRRAVYADGHAQMYGRTDDPAFRGLEGHQDHGVEVLCFWDRAGKLVATAVNVACPSQVVEHNKAISADYWHDVRERLRGRTNAELVVLGWCGAAGDQAPRVMYRKAAEERMSRLRGQERLGELGRRIDQAWADAYEGAAKERHDDVPFAHHVEDLQLTPRLVTAKECADARAQVAKIAAGPSSHWQIWHQKIVDRYEQQQAGQAQPYPMELHVLRLGDVAIATNVFELFTDYGVQIKSRSDALQTFVIQLAGEGSYLPTARAVQGGGYSAVAQSNQVGPEGGQELVEHTVEAIHRLWRQP